MPQISVIVPVYKVEPYLQRCVDSILAQTYPDFELILVDDGSPDDCGRICDEYAETDPRVYVIHQENGGLSAARNSGIDWAFENSDSQWLAFIDSDDWVHPDYLELLYRAANENEIKISICDFKKVDRIGALENYDYKCEIISWESLFIKNNVRAVVAWNKLYSKELFEEKRFPEGKIHEDEFLTYKLLHAADSVAFIPITLYFYFENSEGITGRGFSLNRLDAIEALEERTAFFKVLGNKALIAFSVEQLLNCSFRYADFIKESETISEYEKKEAIDYLKKRSGKILFRYGMKYIPMKDHPQYYLFAFPGVTKMIKWCYKRIKNLHRSGSNS